MDLNPRQKHLLTVLSDYKAYLIVPAVVGMFLAVIYVFVFRSQSWTSRQRLLVRDDLLGQSFKPGQFSSFDTMKSRQETILDIARNPNVIRATLQELGPAKKSLFGNSKDYPDDTTIEQHQGQISLSAPNGAEFGTTEVVVLSVKASTSHRSANLIKKLLDEIEKQIEVVRIAQLKSMEAELTSARDNARKSLQESIDQLRQMELTLGPDSVAMATMTSTMPGDNSIKSETLQIQAEKRGFEAELESLKSGKFTLEQSRNNPLLIVSNACSFFREQTKIAELAKSLVDSQKSYAIAAGKYQEAHPSVKHAAEQLVMMENQVANELMVLDNSLDSRIEELEHQIARLDQQLDQNHERLKRLSEKRGEHLAINSEIAKRTEILNQYEASLKNVQSYDAGSGNTVWVTRIGEPQVAAQPDGLSKRATVLAGGLLGFLFGAGLIVLLAPPVTPDTADDAAASTSTASLDRTPPAAATPKSSITSALPAVAGAAAREWTTRVSTPTQPVLQPIAAAIDDATEYEHHFSGFPIESTDASVGNQVFSSVTIPHVTDEDTLEHIEKFIEKKQQNQRATVEIANMNFAVKSSERMSLDTAMLESTNPESVLASLRAKRAMETDPLAAMANDPVKSGFLEAHTIDQISQLQQAIGNIESFEQKKNPDAKTLFNPVSKPGTSKREQILTSIPDQVRSISDTILGLVEPEKKK